MTPQFSRDFNSIKIWEKADLEKGGLKKDRFSGDYETMVKADADWWGYFYHQMKLQWKKQKNLRFSRWIVQNRQDCNFT